MITEADIEGLITTNGYVSLPSDTFAGALQGIDKTLAKLRAWGVNPDSVKVDDFDCAFVLPRPDSPDPSKAIPSHLFAVKMIMKHRATNKLQDFDVALMQKYGSYPTAVSLVKMAKFGSDE